MGQRESRKKEKRREKRRERRGQRERGRDTPNVNPHPVPPWPRRSTSQFLLGSFSRGQTHPAGAC